MITCRVCRLSIEQHAIVEHLNSHGAYEMHTCTLCNCQVKDFKVHMKTQKHQRMVSMKENASYQETNSETNVEAEFELEDTYPSNVEIVQSSLQASIGSSARTVSIEGTADPCRMPQSALMLAQWWRQSTLPKHRFDELLTLLHTPGFDLTTVPCSTYLMENLEQACLPLQTKFEVIADSSTTPVYFFDLLEVLSNFLDHPRFSDMVFDYQESKQIAHPCNSLGWKRYSELCKELSLQRGTSYQLFCPLFYLDEFEVQRTRKFKLNAIYCTLANLPMETLLCKEEKWLLCLIPPKADLYDTIQEVIIQPCLKLEKGISLTSKKGRSIQACGSAFTVLGDYVGQAQVQGLKGAQCLAPSR
jgi:hypothetical protein